MQAKALSLAAELFRKIEPKKVKPQQAADWNGPFPLPASLAEFYAVVGPAGAHLRGCGNDYFFPSCPIRNVRLAANGVWLPAGA